MAAALDTRVLEGRVTTLETLVLELREEVTRAFAELEVQKRTMVSAVRALRLEFTEKNEKEKEEKEEEKNVRRRRKLPLPLPLTVPEQEHNFHRPTTSSAKKHVYLVDGRMTTELGAAASDAAPHL